MILSDELTPIIDRLDQVAGHSKEARIQTFLERLAKAAAKVGKAWSGSPVGYHSNVYYHRLQSPPAGVRFNPEWGLMDALGGHTYGDWREFDPDEVRTAIYSLAENPDMEMLRKFDEDTINEFNDCKMNVLSIFQVAMTGHDDAFLVELKDKVSQLSAISRATAAKAFTPSGQFASRDTIALSQGIKLPPHQGALSEAASLKNTLDIIKRLAQISKQAKSHISRQELHRRKTGMLGGKVFIGHGHSSVWRELKDFITDRLNLPVDEFNRVGVTGLTTVERLNQMLDTASIAFLIMTGEDEQPDGRLQARMNVVHEVGLFQGRLGFRRALIVLEKDCEEFSNIVGLEQLRFTKGNIKEVFEKIREILEREGLLSVDS